MSKDQRLGDAPIEPKFNEAMNVAAVTLDGFFNGQTGGKVTQPRKVGFVLLVFPFGEEPGGRCNFISNGADRRDVVCLMKEMIARFEGQPEMSGKA
jgi:hypothetical protein